MANKIFNIRVKNKRDTEANWKKKNPVLLDGEIIIVTTTSGDTRFKVGDGKKTYNQLPFQDQKTRDLIPSVDSSLSSTSTNPVQNKIIKSELDKKAERDVVNTTTNGLMSVADKKKLDGIADGANKTTVDSALSSTSTNPVQNKIVNDALKGKFSTSGGGISGDVTMFKRLDVKGVLDAHETILAEKDVQCIYDDNSRIRIACDSSGAAKITTDGFHSYARLKIASPTDNDDATTKNYVDTGLSGKLDKSGGTLTGNLTGKYITGTWLQTTEATDLGRAPGKIAVLDDSGWVYYRTPAEIKSDIGANVDTSLSTTSTNPVQNKAVKTELDKKADKTALDNKFDKSGGDISGDVTMSKFLYLNGPLYAYSTILAKTDVQCLYNDDLRIRLACDSSGVAKITTDGAESYARLKIASPTGNDEAATKKYVDDAIKAYVDSAITVAINSSY